MLLVVVLLLFLLVKLLLLPNLESLEGFRSLCSLVLPHIQMLLLNMLYIDKMLSLISSNDSIHNVLEFPCNRYLA